MAMTLSMDREPEVARFIDTYKFDQDMANKRDRFGGGTSLPLNSDGYEDKQKALRDERHKDWLVQQDKPKEPVYYRVGTPEQGFPGLGEYERQRQEKNIARQKEYNELLKKQRQTEQQKQEARRYATQARPAQQPLAPQMDYNAAGELAKAEERKAYQDYMKAKEERYWAMRGRPVTPPGGLNIGHYDRQVKEQAPQKKQEYKRMLDEQQKEHMFLRARQEPEMAVIDRNAQSSQFLANKPPPGPSYGRGRDEAFKTDSLSQTLPEQSRNEQQYSQGAEVMGRPQSPTNQPPKSPEKPLNPEWLKRPMMDDELPPGVGTPLAFKTNSYANQPPPAPEQGYQHKLELAPPDRYIRQPQSPPQKRDFHGPPFSSDAQKSYRRHENGIDGTYGRTDQLERPRSRRSLDADRKQSPSKRDNAGMHNNKVSPRRMKQQFYEDSEEVSLKRREASKERQKEYNDFLKMKDEQRRHDTEVFQQQHSSKPAEIVKNPFYSSDDYEKFQKELKKKQEKEYSEFLSKEEEQRRFSRDSSSAPKTTYGSTFLQPPNSPFRNVRQTPPSPVRLREHRSDQMSQVLTRENEPSQGKEPHMQNGYSNHSHTKDFQEQNGYPQYGSENGYYNQNAEDYSIPKREAMHQQMTAPYPKAASAPLHPGSPPATPSKLSLPVGQYDDMRPFIVKQRNKEYNSMKEKLPPVKKTGMTPKATYVSLPVGQYDEQRPSFEKERNSEYNELLEKGKIGKHSIRSKIPTPPGLQGLPIGQNNYDPMYRAMEHQRNKEYNDFLQKKYGGNKTFRSSRSLPERPTQPKSSFYYGNEPAQEEKRKMLDDERRNDYNQFMKEREPPRSKSIEIPSDADSGLPIGQHHHEAWRKFLREQRNSEYNNLVEAKKAEVRNRDWNFDQTGGLELRGDDAVQSKKRELRAERREDYKQYISQQKVTHPGRRHEFVDSANGPYGGLFHGLGEHGNRSEDLNRERHREYNERLEQQFAGRDRPGGRPNWVQESLPNNTDRGRSPMKTQPPADQYQQMLDEKRREEANRRRYEDPEYQDRLAQGRDRGEAGQRYGY